MLLRSISWAKNPKIIKILTICWRLLAQLALVISHNCRIRFWIAPNVTWGFTDFVKIFKIDVIGADMEGRVISKKSNLAIVIFATAKERKDWWFKQWRINLLTNLLTTFVCFFTIAGRHKMRFLLENMKSLNRRIKNAYFVLKGKGCFLIAVAVILLFTGCVLFYKVVPFRWKKVENSITISKFVAVCNRS